MPEDKTSTFLVEKKEAGRRLDAFLAARTPLSRAKTVQLIKKGAVTLNGKTAIKSASLSAGDVVKINHPPLEPLHLKPEPIPLKIVYEDKDILVISKPAGLVVHPAPGHPAGTLVNALLARGMGLSSGGQADRPGIVHRLDRDTSGLMIIAKNDQAHARLAAAIKKREVKKTYIALVRGEMPGDDGEIVAPVGRHLKDRKKIAVSIGRGREALTRWRVSERYKGYTLLEVDLVTGRTHQIRVHLAHLGHPVAGDPVYGGELKADARLGLKRQFLHAASLSFRHPSTGEGLTFQDELPDDLRDAVKRL